MLPLSMAATIDGGGGAGGGGFRALPQIRTASSSSSSSSHEEICREQASLQLVGTAARDVAAGDRVPTGVDVVKVLRESNDEDAAHPCGNDAPHQQEEEGCVTPRSEDHVLKPLLLCPPAPRKPRVPTTSNKRKQHDSADDDNNNSSPPTPRHYFVVSLVDLSAVFVRRRTESPKRRKTAGAVPSVAAQQ